MAHAVRLPWFMVGDAPASAAEPQPLTVTLAFPVEAGATITSHDDVPDDFRELWLQTLTWSASELLKAAQYDPHGAAARVRAQRLLQQLQSWAAHPPMLARQATWAVNEYENIRALLDANAGAIPIKWIMGNWIDDPTMPEMPPQHDVSELPQLQAQVANLPARHPLRAAVDDAVAMQTGVMRAAGGGITIRRPTNVTALPAYTSIGQYISAALWWAVLRYGPTVADTFANWVRRRTGFGPQPVTPPAATPPTSNGTGARPAPAPQPPARPTSPAKTAGGIGAIVLAAIGVYVAVKIFGRSR